MIHALATDETYIAGFYSSIPLPYEEIVYSNVNLYLKSQNDYSHFSDFIQTSGFNNLISDPNDCILMGMATVISNKNPPCGSDPKLLTSDGKCWTNIQCKMLVAAIMCSVLPYAYKFIACDGGSQVFRLDWHSRTYPIDHHVVEKLCQNAATILSVIVSSVNYGYFTPSSTSTVVDTLYAGTSKGQRPWIADTINKVIRQPATPVAADADHATATPTNILHRRPFHPAYTQRVMNSPTKHIGSTCQANRLHSTFLHRGVVAEQSQHEISHPPKKIPYFDVVCSENDEVGSRLWVSVRGPKATPSEGSALLAGDGSGFWASWGSRRNRLSLMRVVGLFRRSSRLRCNCAPLLHFIH